MYQTRRTRNQALQDIDRAIQLSPKVSSFHFLKGVILDYEEEDEAALPEVVLSCRLDPGVALHWDVLSRIQARLGRTDEAIESAGKAISLSKGRFGLRCRARAYMKKNNWREAMNDLNQALKAEPNSGQLRTDRAKAAVQLKEWDTVINDSTFCLKSPNSILNDRNHLRLRATAYVGKKQYEKAIADYKAIQKLVPDDRETAADLKALYLKVGDSDSFRAQEKKLKELDEDFRPGKR